MMAGVGVAARGACVRGVDAGAVAGGALSVGAAGALGAGAAGAGFAVDAPTAAGAGDIAGTASGADDFRPSSRAFWLATDEEWALSARAASANAASERAFARGGARDACACGGDAAARVAGLVDDLARHMRAAGELSADGSVHVPDEGLTDAPVFEQRAKLVLMEGVEGAYVVPSGQDWAHDALGDAAVVPGMVYSDGEAFLPGEACIDGYFQADFDGRWVRVERGRACAEGRAIAWRASLEEFPELVAELSCYAEEAGAGDVVRGAVCEGNCEAVCRDARCEFAGAPAASGVRRSA